MIEFKWFRPEATTLTNGSVPGRELDGGDVRFGVAQRRCARKVDLVAVVVSDQQELIVIRSSYKQ